MSTKRTPNALAGAALATIENLMSDPQASPAVRLKAALAILKITEGKTAAPGDIPAEETATPINPVEPEEPADPMDAGDDPILFEPVTTIRREHPKVGRNDLCPCGSNLKYKRCCLMNPQNLPKAA